MPEDLEQITLNFEPSAHFSNIYKFYQLMKINYPFRRDDLTAEEWDDLAELNEEIEKRRYNG